MASRRRPGTSIWAPVCTFMLLKLSQHLFELRSRHSWNGSNLGMRVLEPLGKGVGSRNGEDVQLLRLDLSPRARQGLTPSPKRLENLRLGQRRLDSFLVKD